MTDHELPSEDFGLEDEFDFDEEEYGDDDGEERLDLESMDVYQLLEVAVDSDTENDDRIVAVEKLIKLGSSSAAAIQWLMHSRHLHRLEGFDHRSEVNDLVTGLSLSAEDRTAGLKVIIEDTRLSDVDRASAFAKSLGDGPGRAARYGSLKPLIPTRNLIFGLEEMMSEGDSLPAIDVIREIAADRSLMGKERVRAVTALTDDGDCRDVAVELFQELLQDPALVDAAARKDAEEWVNVLGE
ncbi:hypothetical protein [Sphaerimonospora thailandensis]|uniref:Uncharacterized protein n=1 Tax=Sphaerimonospora thailandensis TaxID=795644 RepID=A0A8J3RC22_9ACTN|nr:hypothetical protein [Sphaerimonospora thailandensis]GIH71064.1 hypothetical protein Mth01_33170 [Sphaerimonospora thailandensis]